MNTSEIINSLMKKYEGENERVGFILESGEVIEVENTAAKPADAFDVSGEDILKYEHLAVATWHTHPNQDSNLSADDFQAFLNWPDMQHYIVGTDGVTKYLVDDGEVFVS